MEFKQQKMQFILTIMLNTQIYRVDTFIFSAKPEGTRNITDKINIF